MYIFIYNSGFRVRSQYYSIVPLWLSAAVARRVYGERNSRSAQTVYVYVDISSGMAVREGLFWKAPEALCVTLLLSLA